MKTRLMLFAVIALLAACKPSKKEQFEKLCGRIEVLACNSEILALSEFDRATVIVGKLSEDSPELEKFFATAVKFPPEDRLKGMHTMAAEELGHPWVCPVWDMEYETGNGCTPKK